MTRKANASTNRQRQCAIPVPGTAILLSPPYLFLSRISHSKPSPGPCQDVSAMQLRISMLLASDSRRRLSSPTYVAFQLPLRFSEAAEERITQNNPYTQAFTSATS